MSFRNFRPTVHAAGFLHEIDDALVFGNLFTRKYDGEVAKLGDEIVFKNVADPTITAVSDKNGIIDAGTVESLEDLSLVMKVEQADTYYFGIGNIDRELAQDGEGLLGKARKRAARKQAEKIDKYLAGLFAGKAAAKLYASGSEPALEKATILGILDKAVQTAEERGLSGSDLFAVITPRFKKLVKQAYVDLDTDNSAMIKNGYVGTYNGLHLVMSNNVKYTGTINTTSQIDLIPIFTREACGYAHPYSEADAEKLQGKFGEAVKGLTLYDGKIIYPKEVMVLNCKYASAAL